MNEIYQRSVAAKNELVAHPFFYLFCVIFIVFQLVADVCARYAGDSSKFPLLHLNFYFRHYRWSDRAVLFLLDSDCDVATVRGRCFSGPIADHFAAMGQQFCQGVQCGVESNRDADCTQCGIVVVVRLDGWWDEREH